MRTPPHRNSGMHSVRESGGAERAALPPIHRAWRRSVLGTAPHSVAAPSPPISASPEHPPLLPVPGSRGIPSSGGFPSAGGSPGESPRRGGVPSAAQPRELGGVPRNQKAPCAPQGAGGVPEGSHISGSAGGIPSASGYRGTGGRPRRRGSPKRGTPPAPRPALHPPAGRPPPPLPSCATGGDHGPGRARAGAAGSAGCGGVGGGLGGSPLCPLGGPSAGRCGAERCGAASRSLSHAQPRAPAHRRYCLRLKRTSRGVPASRRRYGDGESAPPAAPPHPAAGSARPELRGPLGDPLP